MSIKMQKTINTLFGGYMNNYEKIQSMTIDEMAQIFNKKYCEECGCNGTFSTWSNCNPACWAHPKNEYYKQWLEQEEE